MERQIIIQYKQVKAKKPHYSLQNTELQTILLVLLDFQEPPNLITDSQYTESCLTY